MREPDEDPMVEFQRSILAMIQYFAMVLSAFVVLEVYAADRLGIPTHTCIAPIESDPPQ